MPVDGQARQDKQDRISGDVVANYRSGLSTFVTAPTGFGKGNILWSVVNTLAEGDPGFVAMIVTDRVRVTRQNYDRGGALGAAGRTLSVDGHLDADGKALCVTTATAASNLDKMPRVDLLLIDETHHASDREGSMHSAIIDRARAINPDLRVMATTAYEVRHDGHRLHAMVESAERIRVGVQEVLDMGAIVPSRTVQPPHRTAAGEGMAAVVDRFLDPENPTAALSGLNKEIQRTRAPDFFDRCVAEWSRSVAADNRETGRTDTPGTFAYTDTIADSKRLLDAFEAAGTSAAVVNSQMSPKAIDQAFADYRSGKAAVLVSVDMLNEGVDETRTRHLLVAKATTTRSQWIQINGRAGRAHTDGAAAGGKEKTHYTVVDMGASALLHGTMDMHRAVENFVIRGPGGQGAFSPWKCVEGGARTFPCVYAMHDGSRTLFALRTAEKGRFHLFQKEEVRFGAKKSAPARVVKHAAARPLGGAELVKIGHDAVSRRPDIFTTMESRTGDTAAKAVVSESYRQSRDSIMKFAQYLAPERARGKAEGVGR